MGRSNHTVMINRVELEELERKSELLDSLINRTTLTMQNSLFDHIVFGTYEVEMDKDVLAQIVKDSNSENKVNDNMFHKPNGIMFTVKEKYHVVVKERVEAD